MLRWLPKPDVLARRADVLRAAALLLLARLLVAMVAFKRWRGRLGSTGEQSVADGDGGIARAVLAVTDNVHVTPKG